ncbi:MAG: SufE family protein [Cytophagales bacterium]|nr:SufE family protein [Cytophagales bacterium]
MSATNVSIETKIEEIVENFSFLDTLDQKYEYVIELGKKLPPLADIYKREEFIIKGCQSTVWLVPNFDNGLIHFHADSDSVFVKGLISLLIAVADGQPPREVAKLNTDYIHTIGLGNYLSPTRSNGLVAMVKQMKQYALSGV